MMGIGIDDITDAGLDLVSTQTEREIKKAVSNNRSQTPNADILQNTAETPTVTPTEPEPSTLGKIDNLGQETYRNYGRLRDNIEEGDYMHAARNGLKIGRDFFGGDIGRAMKIGSNAVDAIDAIKDGNYGKAIRLGANIVKDTASIITPVNLSLKEQMLYDRMSSGLNNIAQAEKYDKMLKENLDKNIKKAQQNPYKQPTKFDEMNTKVNEMRRQLAEEMKADAAQTLTPNVISAQNTPSEPTPNTAENSPAVAQNKTQTPPPLNLLAMQKRGRD